MDRYRIDEESEFNGIYNLDVVPVPTTLPMIREDQPDRFTLPKKENMLI
jgi:preprotein translocase subunit SecA